MLQVWPQHCHSTHLSHGSVHIRQSKEGWKTQDLTFLKRDLLECTLYLLGLLTA